MDNRIGAQDLNNNSNTDINAAPGGEQKTSSLGRDALIVIGCSLLLTLSAKIEVPFYPVPMTMQTAVVVGLGLVLGWQRALAAVLLYLAQGAAGLPVFAGTPEKGIGLAYMAGPTAGYLFGFILAALATGWARTKGLTDRAFQAFPVALLGMALIYTPGVLWLGVLFGFDKPLLEWGFYPFALGDVLKAALATTGSIAILNLVRKQG